ncbi:MAG: 5'/3'-nucleotidase SurE [Bacillales bacterium]|nr:5'/3'-nucleotidase SurE [Bacillales bacterium]
MKFLLVNDDGFGAEGIVLVEEVLKKFGEVFVVAPKYVQSGKSCSLSYGKEESFIKYDDHHYALDSVPTGCVSFGLYGINQNIDIVVSGCNNGPNLSIDTMYSGTVGACYEALFNGVPAIALSTSKYNDFTNVKSHISILLKYILDNKLYSKDYLLNCNFHKGDNFKGIRFTFLHRNVLRYNFHVGEDSLVHDRYSLFDNVKRGSDVYAVEHGYISITPLTSSTFNVASLDDLKKKIKS